MAAQKLNDSTEWHLCCTAGPVAKLDFLRIGGYCTAK